MDLGIERRRKCCRVSNIPVIQYFRCASPLERERGHLRSKGGGKTTIRFNGSSQNIELLLQMVISVNQLSLYGAVADRIAELPVEQRAPGNPLHQVGWMNKKLLQNLFSQKCKPMKSDKETCCKNMRNDLRNCEKTRSYPDFAPKQVWDRSKLDNFSVLFPSPRGEANQSLFREYTLPREQERTRIKRMDLKQCTIWTSLGHKSLQWIRNLQFWSPSSIFV